MFIVINKVLALLNKSYNFFKNLNKFDLKQSYSNNIGFFRYKLLLEKVSKYKLITYAYIFITLWLCPYLDNLFNFWYDQEVNSFYLMLMFLFLLNFLLNFFITIPTKNTLNFKLFSLQLKSFYFFLNDLSIKIVKLYVFFKNEIFLKSFLFNFLKSNFNKTTNYFIYWRPLFKRFSYFGFYRLVKSKFFKFNKN